MCEGYDDAPEPGQSGRTKLDEFLAEYVDGSMDPTVRAVFEELMRVNPEVAERVCYLKHVRSELCQLNCQCSAPAGFEHRLRRQLAYEMMREQPPVAPDVTEPLSLAAVLASLVLLLTLAGTTYEVVIHDVMLDAPEAVVLETPGVPLEGEAAARALPERFFLPQAQEVAFAPSPRRADRPRAVRAASTGRSAWSLQTLDASSGFETLQSMPPHRSAAAYTPASFP